jgi:hypothetical protein
MLSCLKYAKAITVSVALQQAQEAAAVMAGSRVHLYTRDDR